MADSISDMESDASSLDGGGGGASNLTGGVASTGEAVQMTRRLESLQQENRVLHMELETYRYRCKSLEEENRDLKKARVSIVTIILF